MSTVLKLTVGDADVHEIPFSRLSTLTVTNAGTVVAYSDVSSVEVVDTTTGEVLAKIADDTPGFESVNGAIHVAKGMAVADAGAHIEKALVKFGDDPDLLQIQADISDAVRTNKETWTTSVDSHADDDPQEQADPELLAALAAIAACETVEDAAEKIDAAFETWPDNTELADLKQHADELLAAQTTPPPAPIDGMKLDELRAYAAEIGVDADLLETFKAHNTKKDDVRAAITARLETLARA